MRSIASLGDLSWRVRIELRCMIECSLVGLGAVDEPSTVYLSSTGDMICPDMQCYLYIHMVISYLGMRLGPLSKITTLCQR